MKIKHLIYNYYRSHQSRSQALFPSYERIKSVFILYESDWLERNSTIRQIISQLHEDDKQVVGWGYCEKKDIQSPNLPESRMLGPKDFTLFGTPKKDLIKDIQKRHFDVLIDLTLNPILPLQYMVLYAQADCVIGCREDAKIYDMVIPMPEEASVEYLFQQIIHYLQLIKSAD